VPVLIPVYLSEKGLSVEIITLVAAIGWIPWIIKFSWSGIIDSFSKYKRKIFVLIGSLIAIICFFLLAFIDPAVSIITFTIILFISQIGQSFHDSSADAWAIDISQIDERGKINSAMITGHSIGSGIGALVLTLLAEIYGFNCLFIGVGILILLILIIPILTKECNRAKKQEKVTPLLITEFKKRTTQLVALFALIITISGSLLMFTIPLFATNVLNLSISQIGLISAATTFIIIPGSFIGGIIADKIGRKKTIYSFCVPTILLVLLIFFIDNLLLLLVPYFIIIFLNAGRGSATNAMYMDVTNPKISASHYSIFNSISVLGIVGTGALSGVLIAAFGYSYIFVFISLSLIPPLILLYFIQLNKKKNKM